jgi:hypothetical protein
MQHLFEDRLKLAYRCVIVLFASDGCHDLDLDPPPAHGAWERQDLWFLCIANCEQSGLAL